MGLIEQIKDLAADYCRAVRAIGSDEKRLEPKP
jgi:hypothetical protein